MFSTYTANRIERLDGKSGPKWPHNRRPVH
jgi:hypothetical protein